MLGGLLMLLSLSTLMAIASFLAGSLPLTISLSQSQLRLISTIGMGVLVGTSLIVIIPEGVETLYSANPIILPPSQGKPSSSLKVRACNGMVCARADALVERDGTGLKAIDALPGPVIPDGLGPSTSANGDPPKTPTTPGDVHILEGATSAETHNHPEPRHSSHAWVGISLILGFILMYLIDTLPSLKPPAPPQRMNIYSLSDLASNSPSTPMRSTLPKGSFSTTLGLVIHAAADGIALGASSSQPSLSFIIFLAIMVHKAPAAFGLTSVLLKQGVGKRVARTHLVAFSLAAPCGALFTWIIAHILGGDGEGPGSEENMRWWTGVLLLFSAGTFLYVAMHAMQEDDGQSSGYEEIHANGYLEAAHGREPPRIKQEKSLNLVLAAVAGMLLPLVTQIGHAR